VRVPCALQRSRSSTRKQKTDSTQRNHRLNQNRAPAPLNNNGGSKTAFRGRARGVLYEQETAGAQAHECCTDRRKNERVNKDLALDLLQYRDNQQHVKDPTREKQDTASWDLRAPVDSRNELRKNRSCLQGGAQIRVVV
jgi:hypothetical protein